MMNQSPNRLKRLVFGVLTLSALSLITFATPGWADRNGVKAPPAKVAAEADQLHLILLGYTKADNVGIACGKDVLAMKHHLETAFAKDKGRLVIHNLTGNQWSGAKVLKYLREMKVGHNDNVLVYHSGHGAIANPKQPEKSQVLVLNSGRVLRGEIKQILQGKHPRGLIILTDCCSSFAGGQELPSLVQPTSLNVHSVRNLFVKMRGVVSITAAQDGQSAVASSKGVNLTGARSAFTVALFQVLSNPKRVFTSWEDLFPTLSEQTDLVSGGQHQPRAFALAEPSSGKAKENTVVLE
jgi:hypothetical protein